MNGNSGYAVFFFPQALEALGEAIKPYLLQSPAGLHVACDEVDTAGAFIEMTLRGKTQDGRDLALELMVPGSMVSMIVSTQSDGTFGFGPRVPPKAAPVADPAPTAPAAPTTPAATAVPTAPAAGEPPAA